MQCRHGSVCRVTDWELHKQLHVCQQLQEATAAATATTTRSTLPHPLPSSSSSSLSVGAEPSYRACLADATLMALAVQIGAKPAPSVSATVPIVLQAIHWPMHCGVHRLLTPLTMPWKMQAHAGLRPSYGRIQHLCSRWCRYRGAFRRPQHRHLLHRSVAVTC